MSDEEEKKSQQDSGELSPILTNLGDKTLKGGRLPHLIGSKASSEMVTSDDPGELSSM